MMLWAIISAATALSKDFVGLMLTRFFLGVTEVAFYPGAVYIISVFYDRKEVASRIAILYTGNILATAFAGLIAAGIFHGLDGARGLAGWKWLFIIQGAVTFVIGAISFWVLPDFPLTTVWLTPEERQLAYNRMEMDTVANRGETSTWKGLKEATRDPLVWIFAMMAHMHLAANGFKNFVRPWNRPPSGSVVNPIVSFPQLLRHWAWVRLSPSCSHAHPTSSPVLSPCSSPGPPASSTNAPGTSLSPRL